MATFCEHCGCKVGFFSRHALIGDDFRRVIVCASCHRTAGERAADAKRIAAIDAALAQPAPFAPDPIIEPLLAAVGSDRIAALRAMHVHYLQTARYDAAWCAGRALVFLGAATAGESRYVTDWGGCPVTKARGAPGETEQLWLRTVPRDHDRAITAALAAVPDSYQPPPVESGTPTDGLDFYVGQMLGLDRPPRPATARGDHARDYFALAYELTLQRPGYQPLTSHRERIPALLAAVIRRVEPGAPHPEVPGSDLADADETLGPLSPPVIERLRPAVRGLTRRQLDVDVWARGVSTTAERIGLLLCGDLAVAAAELRERGGSRERLDALVWFSVSREFIALRHLLGLGIG